VNLDDKNGKSDSGFNMWLIMAILLSVVVFVYSWISNKLLKKDLEDLQRQIKSRDSSSNGDMKLPQRISALEKEIKSFV
jgi:cell division protein FtsB